MPIDEHCKDCCCARIWAALKVTGYTGKSIVEHVELLVEENERLKQKGEKSGT